MKHLLLFLLVVGISLTTLAQKTISIDDYESKKDKDEEVQTIMNSFELKRIRGFGGPTLSFSSIGDEFALFTGGGGGLIINSFFIGGYGEALSATSHQNDFTKMHDIEFGHGGFWFGYEFMHQKMIHPVFSVRSGWGRVKGVQNNVSYSDNVFVLKPTLAAEVNFTRFMKVNVGAEYRQVFNAGLGDMTSSDFSDVGVYVSFIFGWF
jgi:hypothetical protein